MRVPMLFQPAGTAFLPSSVFSSLSSPLLSLFIHEIPRIRAPGIEQLVTLRLLSCMAAPYPRKPSSAAFIAASIQTICVIGERRWPTARWAKENSRSLTASLKTAMLPGEVLDECSRARLPPRQVFVRFLPLVTAPQTSHGQRVPAGCRRSLRRFVTEATVDRDGRITPMRNALARGC